MEEIAAIGEKPLQVRLKETSSPFLSKLTNIDAAILPKTAVESLGDEFGASPVGASNYKLADWRRGELLAPEPNEHHYDAPVSQVDRVEWLVVPNDETRALKVMAGELDAAVTIPYTLLPYLSILTDIEVHLIPSTRQEHLLLNHENEWLAKKPIRQAINMALNREAITQLATAGQGTMANSLIPPSVLYHNPDNPSCTYDREMAKSIIEK